MSLLIKSVLLITRNATPLYCKASNPRTIARWVAPTMKELKRRRTKIGPDALEPRSNYIEWNYEAEIFAFGKRLGEEFDRKLLKKALIQREYANLQEFKAQEAGTNFEELEHNHELIQEGEKLISNYITNEYAKNHPKDIVDAVREYLTSESMLAHIGSHIGLKDLVLTNEFPVVDKTLSDTFKATVACLKHSAGEQQAEKFMKDFILTQMSDKEISDIWEPKDPYEYLMKLLSEKGIKEAEPRLCNESASNTILACYQVGIYSNKKLLGIGWGESVHIAKDTAALDAIHKIYSNYVPK